MNKYIVSFFDIANGWWDEMSVDACNSDDACKQARKIMGKGYHSFKAART